MNTAATATTITAAALLLYASASQARASVEAGSSGASFDLGNITDTLDTIMNQITEQTSSADAATAGANIAAFLAAIRQSEGTAASADPYRVCYGYSHTIADLSDHPAITGEWTGQRLPDAMCINAGFGPGCVSTAAGAYQIIKPTWLKMQAALGLPDFSAASQDAAAVELIRRRGALEDVKSGLIAQAFGKCRNEWASLPGNYANQGQRSMDSLLAWFEQSGGTIA